MGERPRLRRGLRWRVVVGMVATALISLVLMAVASVLVARQGLIANQRATALEETRAAMTLVGRDLPSRDPTAITLLNDELRRIGDFEVVAALAGEEIGTSRQLGVADVPTELRPPGPDVRAARTAAGEHLVTAVRVGPELAYYLFFPLGALQEDLTTLTELVALVAVATAVVVVVGTVIATQRLFQPVDETAAAARELAAGALGVRVPDARPGFPDLTAAFNEMAAALEETIERLRAMEARQRQFVADVSHELRTPLTALGTAADLLEPALPQLEGAKRRAGEMLVAEVRRLHKLVNDLMDISRLDAEVGDLQLEEVSIRLAVERLLDREGWEDRVSLSVHDEPVVQADPRRLHVILRNLVDNALTHGAPPVSVDISARGSRAIIEVADAGSGVPDEHRERIFDRFHKTDPARTRGQGSGLGLAIARQTARLLGGDLELAPTRPDEGARFRLQLSTASNAPDPNHNPDPPGPGSQ